MRGARLSVEIQGKEGDTISKETKKVRGASRSPEKSGIGATGGHHAYRRSGSGRASCPSSAEADLGDP